MTNLIQSLKALFTKQEPLQQGFYSYHTPVEDALQYRLHLRIEPNGGGVLIVNASTILHLNQTATEYVYQIIQGFSDEDAINHVADRYNVPKFQAAADFLHLHDQIMTLITTPDLDPVSFLDMDRQIPYTDLSVPYRLDCALTYQVSLGEDVNHAPLDRVDRELNTEEWLTIIKKAFDAGIPHLLFTGGEPTLRDDLPQMLVYAEELGLVTGLLSDGHKLSDQVYLQTLIADGLDHLMLILDPEDESDWQTLAGILAEDLYTTAHLTLTPGKDLKPALDRLAKMQVNAISLSTADPLLKEELQALRDYAAFAQIELVWDMPVPYSHWNPVSLELEEVEAPQGAGNAWMYVEPDGDVLPAQGFNQVLGNMLKDEWHTIWKNR